MKGEWFEFIPALPMPAALIRANDWRIIKVNSAFAHIFGYTVEEAETLNVLQVTPAEDRAGAMQRLKALVEGTLSEYHLERRFLAKDGRPIPVDLAVSAVRDGSGTLEGLLCLMTDISERQKVQDELRRASLAAEDAIRAKNEFLANMSHELRTPLNAISGLTHLTLQSVLDPRQRDNLCRIQEACRDLLSAVNDVLDFSRMELGTLTLESFPFDLRQMVVSCGEQYVPKAEEKGLGFACAFHGEVPARINGDGARLRKILDQLLDNAMKFTERGDCRLEVQCGDTRPDRLMCPIRFTVSDTGIGMDERQIARLNEPFTQADGSSTRRFGGTGLGLSIVRKLLGLMGGQLEIESRIGSGSRFSFSLDFAIAPATGTPPPEQVERLRGARILLVEDNPINQKIVRGILEKQGVAQGVEVAGNGRKALEAVRDKQFDLVLMDIEMPEMDGLEATREIRKIPGRETLPIIAMTGHRMSEERSRFLQAGMNDGLEKPIAAKLLIAMLLRWIPAGTVQWEHFGETSPAEGKTVSGLPDHLPGIDLRGCLQRIENNQGLLVSLLCEFREQNATFVQELEEVVAAGKVEEARHKVHSLKGVAANLGLIRVQRTAIELETAMKTKETVLVRELVSLLHQHLDEAFESIERLGEDAEGMKGRMELDQEAAALLVGTLTGQLATRHLGALESFAELERVLRPCPELEVLRKALRKLDFPMAQTALGRLVATLGLPSVA